MGILDTITSPEFAVGLSAVGEGLSAVDVGRSANMAPYLQQAIALRQKRELDKSLGGGIIPQILKKNGMSPEASTFIQGLLKAAPNAVLPHILGMAFPKGGKDPRYNVGGALVDANGNVIYKAPDKAPDPMKAIRSVDGVGMVDFSDPQNPRVIMPTGPDLTAREKQARAGGLVPGTPEYNNFVLNKDAGKDPIATLKARAAAAGLKEGTPEYREFMHKGGAGRGSRTVYGPDGTPIYHEGDAGSAPKPLRDFEAKALQFYSRMKSALPRVLAAEDALMKGKGGPSMLDTFADNFGSAGNFIKSKEYQTYQAAAREWIAGLLRLDSGAAVPEPEFTRYFATHFFAPGDNEQTMENKRKSRIAAMEALKKIQPAGREDTNTSPPAMKPLSEMTDEELRALAEGR